MNDGMIFGLLIVFSAITTWHLLSIRDEIEELKKLIKNLKK